jgi:hypothetical protein
MKGVVLVSCAWLLACAPTDVVIATSDGGGRGGRKCMSDSNCRAGEFCSRVNCDDRIGHCQDQEADCPAIPMHVCGCDGITYWNDCLRKAQGITASTPESCTVNGLACTGPGTCPNGASCKRFVLTEDQCSPDNAGLCWMLPPACPAPDPTSSRYVSCADATSCVDACAAIRTEQPHHHTPTCQ